MTEADPFRSKSPDTPAESIHPGPEIPPEFEIKDDREDAAESLGHIAVAETTESIEEVARREYEEEAAWREHRRSPDPKPKEKSSAEKVAEHEIPDEIIKAAAEHGLSIEYLIHAKGSPAAGERLRKMGIDWGAEKPEEPSPGPEDPRIEILRRGKAHRETVQEIQHQIEESPGELRRSLKQSGGSMPVIRGVRRYWKAWQIFRKHKATRPKTRTVLRNGKEAEEPILYNDGVLGLGHEFRKQRSKFIKRHNQEIALSRSQLRRVNRNELYVLESYRRRLAERILRLRRQEEALSRNTLVPSDFYDHSEFKNKFKEYEKTKASRGIEFDKYDEFPQAKGKGAEPLPIAGTESPHDRDSTMV